jgi:outer membrane scaffolding protein for murein synthesis (MipA/OmpV family)
MKWDRFYTCTFYISLFPTLLFSSFIVHSNEDAWKIKVGVAPLSASLPWKGLESQSVLAPYLDVRIGRWSFGVESVVSYEYQLGDHILINSGINLRDQGYKNQASVFRKSSNDPVFIDYQRPNQEFAATSNIRWQLLSFEVNQDISNNSRSTSITSSIDIPLYRHKNGMLLKGTVNALWYSASYVDYYFGIKPQQENLALGRHRYKGQDTVNHQFTLNAIVPINARWELVSIISHTELGDGVFKSPLIDTRDENKVSIALSYLL